MQQAREGFCLERLEVYNWGTFGHQVWSLAAEGRSALLTGNNGSGKSTLVDALLTLLVPNRKRNYNLSSGSEKRERTEKSYVLGAWGKEQNEFNQGQTKFLRGKGDYTVILGVFANDSLDETVTLAQFFWHDQMDLKKFFVVSHKPLSISQDFSKVTSAKALKKRLKAHQSTLVYDTFGEYEAYFNKAFGLRSPKAMGLFNQVVAIKEVGRLNDFVRQHMLDQQDARELLQQLNGHYNDLQLAHQAIVLAKRQLDELEPLCEAGDKLEEFEEELKWRTRLEAYLPVFFNERKATLIRNTLINLQGQQQQVAGQLSESEAERDRWQDQCRRFEQQLAGSGVANLRKEYDLKIKHQREYLETKRRREKAYLQLTKVLGFEGPDSADAFVSLRDRAETLLQEAAIREQDLAETQLKAGVELSRVQNEMEKLQQDYRDMQHQKGKIPAPLYRVRLELAAALQVPVSKLPFAAELICVKEKEKKWRPVIENLLFGFGQRLLVADDCYREVNKYLRSKHIGIKLVYERIEATGRERARPVDEETSETVYGKLDFYPKNSKYVTWVKDHLRSRYNYRCVESLREFNAADQAVTPEGLIKRSRSLHEKDDRRGGVGASQQFILGWQNEDLLQAIHQQIVAASQELKDKNKTLETLTRQTDELAAKVDAARKLLDFEDFESIHAAFHRREIERLTADRNSLGRAGNQAEGKVLGELEKARESLQEASKRRDQLLSEAGILQNRVIQLQEDLAYLESLEEEGCKLIPEQQDAADKQLHQRLKKLKLSLQVKQARELDAIASRLAAVLEREQRELLKQRSGFSTALIRKMATFKATFPEPCLNLDASVEYLDGYRGLRDKLIKESLPQHEKRFSKLLSKSVVSDMMAFKSSLDLWYDEMSEDIEQLNESLRGISYSPGTYVQLRMSRSRDTDVREFLNMLTDAIKVATSSQDHKALMSSFEKIRRILLRLNENERWSMKVTDVRNWADFFVSELALEDDSQRNYYSDSGGLSGGQKAKLAFTILASSIAHQYGLNLRQRAQRTFRFVVIDEAFSKSDEINSRFAMDLFHNLGLQLMVVTPRDKIYVVEPYVKKVFLTTINKDLNDSQIHSLHVEEYREKKSKPSLRRPTRSKSGAVRAY